MSNAVAGAPDLPEAHALLTSDEVDRLFARLMPLASAALGVSGGPDSLALLYLFNDWRLRSGWPGRALVLTVDHRLRPESVAEAEAVSEHCKLLGLDHATLVWEGGKPVSNLQAEARAARYRLMAGAMRRENIECLLLAHHRDDQAETFLDRLTRGSGVYGLGAMDQDQRDAPEGLRLLRPLLDLPKARLVADLARRGVEWAEDPSNENSDYKRVRLRAVLSQLDGEGLDTRRISETARRLRRAADAIDTWVDRAWLESVDEHPAGPIRLVFSTFVDLPEEVRLRLLSRLVLRATGRVTPLRLSKLEHAEAALLETDSQLTLAGAVLLRQQRWLYIWREAGREPPPVTPLGAEPVWDGRFTIDLSGCDPAMVGKDTSLGPLILAPGTVRQIEWPPDWPRSAFDTAPAIWRAETVLLVCGLFQSPDWGDETPPDIRLIPRCTSGRQRVP